jgi:hypothetical protein
LWKPARSIVFKRSTRGSLASRARPHSLRPRSAPSSSRVRATRRRVARAARRCGRSSDAARATRLLRPRRRLHLRPLSTQHRRLRPPWNQLLRPHLRLRRHPPWSPRPRLRLRPPRRARAARRRRGAFRRWRDCSSRVPRWLRRGVDVGGSELQRLTRLGH